MNNHRRRSVAASAYVKNCLIAFVLFCQTATGQPIHEVSKPDSFSAEFIELSHSASFSEARAFLDFAFNKSLGIGSSPWDVDIWISGGNYWRLNLEARLFYQSLRSWFSKIRSEDDVNALLADTSNPLLTAALLIDKINEPDTGAESLAQSLKAANLSLDNYVLNEPGAFRLHSIKPYYLVENSEGHYEISLKGLNFEDSNFELFFNLTTKCDTTRRTNTTAIFKCHDPSAKFYGEVGSIQFILQSSTATGFNLFGLLPSSDSPTQNFIFDLPVIPKSIGSYRVWETQAREDSVSRSRTFTHRNRSCISGGEVNWTIAAEDGWKINPKSVSVKPVEQSAKTKFLGITGASDAAVEISANVMNVGTCGPKVSFRKSKISGGLGGLSMKVPAVTHEKDRPGYITLQADWTEFKSFSVKDDTKIEEGVVLIDEHVEIPLSDTSDGFSIAFRFADDSQMLASETGNYQWVEVGYDEEKHTISIVPAILRVFSEDSKAAH